MRRKTRPTAAIYATLALAVGAAAFGALRAGTGGTWAGPSDGADSALAAGASLAGDSPFRLNPGDPAWPWGAGPLYALVSVFPSRFPAGIAGNGAWAWLFAVNAALFAWTLISVARAATGLLPGWLSVPALLALAISGPICSSFFSLDGTGLSLALACALWAAWAWHIEGNWRALAAPVTLSLLLSLTGPSGAFIAIAASVAAASQCGRRRALPALLAGSSGPAAVLLASYLAGFPPSVPETGAAEAFRGAALGLAGDLHGLWTGMLGTGWGAAALSVVPGTLLLLLVGLVQPGPARPAVSLAGTFLLASLLAAKAGPYFGRDPGPLAGLAFPFLVVIGFSGAGRACEFVPEQWRKPLGRGIAAAWILSSLPGLAASLNALRMQSQESAGFRRVLLALPGGSGIIAPRPGLVRRYSVRPVFSLAGRESPWLAGTRSAGWAGWHDRFKGEAADRRPGWVLMSPDRQEPLPSGFLAVRPDYGQPGPVVAEIRWRPAEPPPRIPGWRVSDEIDCTLPRSEETHSYRVLGGRPSGVLAVPASIQGDGGWNVATGESFSVSAEPGHPLVVMARLAPGGNARLAASLNGSTPDIVPISAGKKTWQEIVLVQSDGSKVLAKNRVSITLSGTGAGYVSFHYWAYQPERTR